MHPLLKKLGLISAEKNASSGENSATTALDVLYQLLLREVVTPESVESAYEAAAASKRSRDSTNRTDRHSATVKLESKTAAVTHRTRHIALRFYYDGADYSGLAQNMGHPKDNSVEKALFAALVKTRLVESRKTSGYSRCGRTDKGVSAAGQVVALRLKSQISMHATWDPEGQSPVTEKDLPKNPCERILVWVPPKKGDGPRVQREVSEYPYAKILNNLLPETIRVLGWCPVSNDFSARFSATTRTYRYFFLGRHLCLDRVRQALRLLVGTHDFRNFCKMDVEKVYNFERKIHSAELMECEGQCSVCYLQIVGQAFLWHQIRCIASVMFMIGRGLEPPSIVTDLLDVSNHPGKPSYPLAAERPLVLHQCGYPNLQMGYSVPNVFSLSCQMEQQWEDLVLAAARVRNCVESLRDQPIMRSDLLSFVTSKLQERFKKLNKYKSTGESLSDYLANLEDGLSSEPILTWGEALQWMEHRDCRPDPQGLKEISHIPLLQRARGTTYEEKVEALSTGSEKRRQKYEENVIKKRKTAQEDAAFYSHMMKQGGSGI